MATTVLVEGASDRIALESLAGRLGHDLARSGVRIVELGGATNAGRFLQAHRLAHPEDRVAGLYDAAEERFFRRGLERAGFGPVPDRRALERLGFFACVEDLEDELLRSLGVTTSEAVIEEQGELASLRILQRQPFQRTRTHQQQLHRFVSSRSGRKSLYAEALVAALDLDRAPRPLLDLLARVT